MKNIYRKGRRKEYLLINEAKKKGLIAFRSAGSHSPVDVVILDFKNHKIRLLQSKTYQLTLGERMKILSQMPVYSRCDVTFEIV